ncbi:unnamed protein product [Polarella glacialis]|uniref:RRM domain-containing protein n=2 Tax=Polarella glacialis TaxID=89957 RepID=A0A813E807_POLGL|nr:unnamed protein product [Polarella glacialis]
MGYGGDSKGFGGGWGGNSWGGKGDSWGGKGGGYGGGYGGGGDGWGGGGKGGYGGGYDSWGGGFKGMMNPFMGFKGGFDQGFKGGFGKGQGKGKGKQLKVDDALKIWLGNIPASTKWKELQAHVDAAGKSKWVEIFEGKGKGTAAVVYSTADEAANAIRALNGTELNGESIIADTWARTPKA